MTEVLYWLIGLGPYFLAALVLGFGLGAAAPWLLKHPDKWLFFAILGLNLLPFGGGDAEGSLYRQITWGGLFLFAAFHAMRDVQGRLAFPRGQIPVPLALLIAYVLITVAWSPNPELSLKRAVQVVGVLLLALAIARHKVEGDAMLAQLIIPAGVFIVLGVLMVAAAPGWAFDTDHALRAMTIHKNTWGQFSLLASIVFLVLLLRGGQRLLIKGIVLAVCVISLVMSRSTTSVLSFAIIATAAMAWLLVARGGIAGRVAIFIAVLVTALGVHGYTVVTGEFPFEKLQALFYEFTGKRPTLTGRTYLWELMVTEIQRHPWFGIGYGGFWTQQWDSPAQAVILRLTWGPPAQAHSGYIDVVNELGIVGASLLLIVLVQHTVKIIGLFRAGLHDVAAFHAALLFAALSINYAESSLLRTTHFWWIVLCISIITVHRLTQTRGSEGQAAGGIGRLGRQGAGVWA